MKFESLLLLMIMLLLFMPVNEGFKDEKRWSFRGSFWDSILRGVNPRLGAGPCRALLFLSWVSLSIGVLFKGDNCIYYTN